MTLHTTECAEQCAPMQASRLIGGYRDTGSKVGATMALPHSIRKPATLPDYLASISTGAIAQESGNVAMFPGDGHHDMRVRKSV
jgi:hypothetical protein